MNKYVFNKNFGTAVGIILGQSPELLTKVFQSNATSTTRKYSFNVYKRGRLVVVTVDDTVPVDIRGTPNIVQVAGDNSFWYALLEKAYAKAKGSYENSLSGSVNDALAFLVNSPSKPLSKVNEV